jgi:DEAD/DEAH box helicase domain-containing protein
MPFPSFTCTWTHTLDPRPASYRATMDLPLGAPARNLLACSAPNGVFHHQYEAVAASLAGHDVCVATGTASGKSLVFQTVGVEHLARDPRARVLALYPMKALGCEQEARWRAALERAGVPGTVARIDGSVSAADRLGLIRTARVVIATPDVVHAWMLPRAGQTDFGRLRQFLRRLSLVVIDEAHTYSGIFGSNSAFLLRRLLHAAALLGAQPRFVAASATLRDPAGHLERLTGRTFSVVGPDRDTSPRHPIRVELVRPADPGDFHATVAEVLGELRDRRERFIAFLDSRKGTEQMAAILQRDQQEDESFGHLLDAQVLPFRAGYEAAHRDAIQQRLTDGTLVGVLSTSALELGLDIHGLGTAVLVGVPASRTSFLQRIGRVGRAGPGRVVVVHSGTVSDDVAFAHPEGLFDRPLAESTVYLENQRIQYIHAMAIAREHDLLSGATTPLDTGAVAWPPGFLALAEDERRGTVPRELRDMKRDAGEMAVHAFPLRDVETQFEVFEVRGRSRERLGSLSHAQLMREAYPGAIYYYIGRPFRVRHVDLRAKEVLVAGAPQYTTTPAPVVSRIAPQRAVHRLVRYGDLVIADSDLQIRRAVMGFRERRGPVADAVIYPCTAPVTYSQPAFSRTLFTTGMVLAHPSLDAGGVSAEVIAGVLLDALLLTVPIERQEVDAACDVLRGAWGSVGAGRRVLVLYDQTYGSLHLTARFQDRATLVAAFELVVETLAERDAVELGSETVPVTPETRSAAAALLAALRENEPAADTLGLADAMDLGERVRVMLPRSHGTMAGRPSDRFEIHQIFLRADLGLCYRGVWIGADSGRTPGVVPITELQPVGEVIWGFYDPETGEQAAA